MHNAVAPSLFDISFIRHKQYLWLAGLAGVIAAALAAWAAGESLWVDELHTSWAISGELSEVAARSRSGNQSPLFFWGLWGLVRTLGLLPIELALRLPSILAWGGCVAVAVWQVGHSTGCAATASNGADQAARVRRPCPMGLIAVFGSLCLWLLADRVQLFYATEARVYAVVQLLSLLAWCCIGQLWHIKSLAAWPANPRVAIPIWVWCVLCSLLVHIHVMAVLTVAWQIVVGWIISRAMPSVVRRQWNIAAVVVVGFLGFAVLLSSHLWQQRQQWESFAGEATLSGFLGLFPLLAFTVPVLLARFADWTVGPSTSRSIHSVYCHCSCYPYCSWLWLIATLGPWIVAWLVTAWDIAPIFHRRYVIVAGLPLILWAVTELSRVRRLSLRYAAGAGTLTWLLVSQGTFATWQAGQVFGWQRIEGWRSASEWIDRQFQADAELWCASGLIEGRAARWPLSAEQHEYLSFPLRGPYRVRDQGGRLVEPLALVGNGRQWGEQLVEAGQLAESPHPTRSIWIVYRGQREQFNRHLQSLSSHVGPQQFAVEQMQTCGLVSAAKVRISAMQAGSL